MTCGEAAVLDLIRAAVLQCLAMTLGGWLPAPRPWIAMLRVIALALDKPGACSSAG